MGLQYGFHFLQKENVPSVVGMHVCFQTATSLKNDVNNNLFYESLNHDNLSNKTTSYIFHNKKKRHSNQQDKHAKI
jgi:hypothetical protein